MSKTHYLIYYTYFKLMLSNRIGLMQKTYMHLFPTIQDEIVDLLDNL